MPKKQIVGSILIIIVLSFICMVIYDRFKIEKEIQLAVSENQNCHGNLDLYYTDSNQNHYYLYCLNHMIVDFGDRTLELNKALEAKQINMDFVFSNLKKKDTFDDGGSVIYRNSDFALLQCNTLEGNHDTYFGPSNMQYREGFCKENAYTCSFIRTYLVLDVSDSNDDNFIYLTLREFQGEEVVTVKVNRELNSEIIEDSYYEFQFASTGKSIETDINTIFNSNQLLAITLTDKMGTNQINENSCK